MDPEKQPQPTGLWGQSLQPLGLTLLICNMGISLAGLDSCFPNVPSCLRHTWNDSYTYTVGHTRDRTPTRRPSGQGMITSWNDLLEQSWGDRGRLGYFIYLPLPPHHPLNP